MKSPGKKWGRPRFNADGSIVYPIKGTEPPPNIQGYKRDPGNAWRFIKLWPECLQRQEEFSEKSCGAIQIVPICVHKEGAFFRKVVTHQICEACPLRQLHPPSAEGNTGPVRDQK